MKLVIIESPFAGKGAASKDIEANVTYGRACMADCLRRGEAPYASHLLYTLPGVLDDTVPEERKLGMEAGFAWGLVADETVVYVDRGISQGMAEGIVRATKAGRKVVFRSLVDDKTAVEAAQTFIWGRKLDS